MREYIVHVRCNSRFASGMLHGAKAWIGDVNTPNFVAARKAIEAVFGVSIGTQPAPSFISQCISQVTPDLTREGGSIPVTLTIEEVTGKSVMLLPIGKLQWRHRLDINFHIAVCRWL